jgi:FlaA1/EpsC-like NDP-sugar epimerase
MNMEKVKNKVLAVLAMLDVIREDDITPRLNRTHREESEDGVKKMDGFKDTSENVLDDEDTDEKSEKPEKPNEKPEKAEDTDSLQQEMSVTHGLILVTGGAGYVGSHAVVELLNAGYRVVAVDNFVNAVIVPTGETDYSESLLRVQKLTGKSCKFHNEDLLDKSSLSDVLAKYPGISCVIHFAALKADGESLNEVLKYYGNNITGACNLLEVMTEAKMFRIVFSSSAAVYVVPEYLPLDEKSENPENTNEKPEKAEEKPEKPEKDDVYEKPEKRDVVEDINPQGNYDDEKT